MELRQYLQIILRKWWLILPFTAIAVTVTAFFSYSQTPIYESTSSYVVGLSAASPTEDPAYLVDILAGRERILVTYCQIMTSNAIRTQVAGLIGVDPVVLDPNVYKIFCNVLPTSNVLELVINGPSPELVNRMDEATGLAGMARANDLYVSFPLQRLDPPFLNPIPVAPSHSTNLILGGVLGLTMSISLSFFLEYLRSPRERIAEQSIREAELGLYNARYFQKRLVEENHRARVRHRPISVAMMRMVPDEDFVLLPENVQHTLMRRAALRVEDQLRGTDLMAYMGNYTFGILLGETPGDEARDLISALHDELRTRPFNMDDYTTSFIANTGILESSGGTMEPDGMVRNAYDALLAAEQVGNNIIQLFRASPRPFHDGQDEQLPSGGQSSESSPFADFRFEDLLQEGESLTGIDDGPRG